MPKKILIVDDDPNIQDTAKDILEDAGYVVETAGTGAAALQKIGTQGMDIVVIDHNLPDGKGLDFAVKAKAACPPLIIILMTGEANVDLGPAQAAIQTILTKPVNPSQLIEIIRQTS